MSEHSLYRTPADLHAALVRVSEGRATAKGDDSWAEEPDELGQWTRAELDRMADFAASEDFYGRSE